MWMGESRKVTMTTGLMGDGKPLDANDPALYQLKRIEHGPQAGRGI